MKKPALLILLIIFILLGGAWLLQDDHHDHRNEHYDEHGHNEHSEAITTSAAPVRADGAFTLVTSFYPLQFALEALTDGIKQIEVINIGTGRDPHDVQLSVTDVQQLQDADLVVVQGADLEPWGEAIAAQLRKSTVPMLIVADHLALREHADGEQAEHDDYHDEEEDDAHDHGAFDPHTWLDPALFADTTAHLAEILATLDPEHTALYQERHADLTGRLTQLDTDYSTRLATCALDEVITSHDAFGYVGARYGFAIHTIAGLSTQDSPSVQTLAHLREEAAEGISAILLEENSVAAYGETLAQETGLRTLPVNPIAYLVPAGEDYVSLMYSNLDTFADALDCT